MTNREVRNRALNILENGTQAQYQNEAVKEYLEAKAIAIDSIKKLEKIELIVNKWISLEEKPNFCMMEIREVIENG